MATYSQLTWDRQYTYPTTLKRYTRGLSLLYNANHPLYFIYGDKDIDYNIKTLPTTTINPYKVDKYELNFRLKIMPVSGSTLYDLSFNIFGITFNNTTTITSSNQFIKTSDLSELSNSIESMFQQNNIFENWEFPYPGYFQILGGDKYFNFTLRARRGGSNLNVSSTMIRWEDVQSPSYINLYSDDVIFNNLLVVGGNYYKNVTNQPKVWIWYIETLSTPSKDLNQYQIGLNLYKIKNEFYSPGFTPPFGEEQSLLTTVSKKGVGVADFELSNIIRNSLEDWRPIIYDFNIGRIKYIDKFKVKGWQKYIKNNESYLGTYVDNKFDEFYVIDSSEPLFENYKVPTLIDEEQVITPNLDYFDSGDYFPYDKNLTRQPRYKELNKSYEILYNNSFNVYQTFGSVMSDKAYLEFFFVGTSSTETLELSSTSIHSYENPDDLFTFRWINQLCFNTSNLKNRISGNWNEVYKIKAHFYNPNYKFAAFAIPIQVTYETQEYYINNTIQNCDDEINNDIDYVPIVFKNSKGAFDLFEFDSIIELKTSRKYDSFISPYTYQSSKTSEFEKVFVLDYNKTYKIKTRLLNNDEFEWLEDLVKSKQVYVLNLDDNQLYPIIIQDTDYGFSNNNSDRQISITFNYSRPEVTA